MKTRHYTKFILFLCGSATVLLGQSWSQFANLVIAETYYDGTDERIYIINQGSDQFSGSVTISGASSQTIKRNLNLSGGQGILLCDQCSMVKSSVIWQTGVGLSLSDTTPRTISLRNSGLKIDEFGPGGLIGQLNDKKQSIIKHSTGYQGSSGLGCIEGYLCDLLHTDQLNNKHSIRLLSIYGGDECVGEYLQFIAEDDFSGSITIGNRQRSIGKIISGDSILFSNQSGWSANYIYGYSGNIVQSKGGILQTTINGENINYTYGEMIGGMMKQAGSGDTQYYLSEDVPVDIDSSCYTSNTVNPSTCGDVGLSGRYDGVKRNIMGSVNNDGCWNMRWRWGEKTGSGCTFGFEQTPYNFGTLHIEGLSNGQTCEQDIFVVHQGYAITGQRSNIINKQSSQNDLVVQKGCNVVLQESQAFYAGEGFNVGLEINGKMQTGTGCLIKRGNETITNKCNPSSITIATGGLGWLTGIVYTEGLSYECSIMLNLPSKYSTQKTDNLSSQEEDTGFIDKLISGLAKWGLWYDIENQKIDVKKIYDSGDDVGIPSTLSNHTGDLVVDYINPKPDQTSDSEFVKIKHIREYWQYISGHYLIYRNKWHDISGFWGSGQEKTLVKKRGFDNTSGCAYLATKEYVQQIYCRNTGLKNNNDKKDANKGEGGKKTSKTVSSETINYDYTKEQCETEKDLIEYAYRDYIEQIKSEQKITKKKKMKQPSKQQKTKKSTTTRIKKYTKTQQELRLYKNFVSLVLNIINRYRVDVFENDEYQFILKQFETYKKQINQSRGGAQIYTGNILQQSFKGYTNPDPYSQLQDLLQ